MSFTPGPLKRDWFPSLEIPAGHVASDAPSKVYQKHACLGLLSSLEKVLGIILNEVAADSIIPYAEPSL